MATPFASRKYVDTSVAGLFDGVEYDSTNKKIIFKHGSTQKAYVDATAFIKDGMVDTVAISSGNLVITFNTDAGKEAISIPLTDIFNPANYYDKTAADGRYVQKETGKGLSTEDYTSAEKTKLGGVEAGAQANVIETVKVNGTALTPSSKAVDIAVPAAQIQSDWSQSDSTKKDFIKNKPTIPAAVTVVPPSTSATTGQAADAKVTGDMLYTGFTPWKADSPLSGYDFESCVWKSSMSKWEVSWKAVAPGGTGRTTLEDGAEDDVSITGSSPLAYSLSRIRVTPTKTSQLTNDGDGTSPFAKVSQLPDVSGFATKTDLPYQFVPVVVEQGVATVTPRTVATFTATSTQASFTVAVGTGTAGAARDCVLVVDCTAAGAVAPTVTWPSNFHPRTDTETDLAIVEAGKRAVFYISEYEAGEFAVGGWTETAGGNA